MTGIYEGRARSVAITGANAVGSPSVFTSNVPYSSLPHFSTRSALSFFTVSGIASPVITGVSRRRSPAIRFVARRCAASSAARCGAFWTAEQAAFLREARQEHSDWAEVVDELNCLLRD